MREKGFYTYSLGRHGFTHLSEYGLRHEMYDVGYPHDTRSGLRGAPRCHALVFEPDYMRAPSHEVAASIAGMRFMPRLFEHGFLVAHYRHTSPGGAEFPVLAASSTFEIVPLQPGRLVGNVFFFWEEGGATRTCRMNIEDVLSSCCSIERVVGNCANCHVPPEQCFRERLQTWLQRDDVRQHVPQIRNILNGVGEGRLSTIDKMEESELVEFFGEFGESSAWAYVSPGKTGRPLSDSMRPICHHWMHELNELAAERSRNAKKAVETKAALKRCANRCILYPACPLIQRSYGRKFAKRCQHGNFPGRGYKPGPYTRTMFEAVRAELLSKREPSWRPRHEVALIAYNAGVKTRLLGPELQLVGMDCDMNGVLFRRTRLPHSRKVMSFEDAVEVCRLPFWHRGAFRHTAFVDTRNSREPLSMSDEELHLYWEICSRRYLRKYNYPCGSVEPLLMCAAWRGAGCGFSVQGHVGWECGIGGVEDIEPVFDSFPFVFRLFDAF